MSEDLLRRRVLLLFLFSALLLIYITFAHYSTSDLILIIGLFTFFGLVESHLSKYLKGTPFRCGQETRKRLKWANKRYYGFLCDPKLRSNPTNYRMKFFCSRSQKQIESPLSATVISLATHGFEFDETKRGWRNIKVSRNLSEFKGSYLTFETLSGRVQGAYFNFDGISYPAGCALYLDGCGEELTEKDRQIFLEFSKNQKFWSFIKAMENPPKPINLRESDLEVLYASRSLEINDFVIFARNSKNGVVQQFIYNTDSYGFERIPSTELEYDEKKNLEDGKRHLLFMTYSKKQDILETLTVYRKKNRGIEKKILNFGESRFEVLQEKPIVSTVAEEVSVVEEDGFEIVARREA